MQHILSNLTNKPIPLLYMTPEKFMTFDVNRFLKQMHTKKLISRFVVDEFQVVSEHQDFRDSYTKLRLKHDFDSVPILCCSATADASHVGSCHHVLGLQDCKFFRGDMQRFNISIHTEMMFRAMSKNPNKIRENLPRVAELLRRHKDESFIVFVIKKVEAVLWSSALQKEGFSVDWYHGTPPGATDIERMRIDDHRACVQERWKTGKLHGVVATSSSFGLGIDKENVRCVIHVGLPISLAACYQGFGRAGRDGKPADAYLLFDHDDFGVWKTIKRNCPAPVWAATASGLRDLLRFCHDKNTCRHKALIRAIQCQQSIRLSDLAECAPDDPRCDVCQRQKSGKELVEITQHVQSCFNKLVAKFNSTELGSSEKAVKSVFDCSSFLHGNGQDLAHTLVRLLDRVIGAIHRPDRSTCYEVVPDAQSKLSKHRFFIEWVAGQEWNVPTPAAFSVPEVSPVPALNLYEQQRIDNITRNHAYMMNLGLGPGASSEQHDDTIYNVTSLIPEPESSQHVWVSQLSYDLRFEVESILLEWGLSWKRFKAADLKTFVQNGNGSPSEAAGKLISASTGIDCGPWRRYCQHSNDESIFFTFHGSIQPVGPTGKHRNNGNKFEFRLKAPIRSRPKRAYRKFGYSRFLRLSVGQGCDSASIKSYLREIHDSGGLLIGGRNFKLLSVDASNSDSGPKGNSRGTLVFFAESGPGLNTIEVSEVQEWHQPSCFWQQDLPMRKFLKRQSLMTSDVTPTCIVSHVHMSELPDIVSVQSGAAMTDGSAPISERLMKRIADHLPERPGSCLPSLVQMRYAGLKGVLYVDSELQDETLNYCPSMQKIIHSAVGMCEEQQRLEVCRAEYPTMPPSKLNVESIQLLEGRMKDGAAEEIFSELLEQDISQLRLCLENAEAAKEMVRLRDVHSASSGGEFEQRVSDMLRAGFEPGSCIFLKRCLQQLVLWRLEELREKFKITVPESCRLTITEDRQGILKPDECFINLGGRLGLLTADENPAGVVLMRNPSYQPGDILHLKLVSGARARELSSRFRHGPVCMLSTQGNRMIADMLCGGDCDGDKPWVCWHQRIVCAVLHVRPTDEMVPIQRSIFVSTNPAERREDMIEFFCTAILRDTLGSLVNKLRWAADELGADDPKVIEIAKLCMQQVDTPDEPIKPPEWLADLQCPHWDKKNSKHGEPRQSNRVLGKLANQIDGEIGEVESLVVTQSDLQVDPDLCSCTVDSVMQETRQMLDRFRQKWREWDESGNRGRSIALWEREVMSEELSKSQSHDKLRAIASCAYKQTLEQVRTRAGKDDVLQLRAVHKYVACCWSPMLPWLCRIKADSIEQSSGRGIAISVARRVG